MSETIYHGLTTEEASVLLTHYAGVAQFELAQCNPQHWPISEIAESLDEVATNLTRMQELLKLCVGPSRKPGLIIGPHREMDPEPNFTPDEVQYAHEATKPYDKPAPQFTDDNLPPF